MATRSRIAPTIDVGRLRAAIAGPGADPRTWGFEGRIDDDPDAIRWDEKLGWLCDVTVTGGQLDGEGPITCRVMIPFAGNGLGGPFHPPRRDLNVVCMLPQADLNSTPVIVGYVFDDNSPAPTAFGNLSASESNMMATHAMKSDKDVDLEFAGNGKAAFGDELRLTADSLARVDAETVKLRDQVEVTASRVTINPSSTVKIDALLIDLAGASQPFVRGQDLTLALTTYVASLTAYIASLTTCLAAQAAASPALIAPNTPMVAAGTAYVAASAAVLAQLPLSLSLKIKGE